MDILHFIWLLSIIFINIRRVSSLNLYIFFLSIYILATVINIYFHFSGFNVHFNHLTLIKFILFSFLFFKINFIFFHGGIAGEVDLFSFLFFNLNF